MKIAPPPNKLGEKKPGTKFFLNVKKIYFCLKVQIVINLVRNILMRLITLKEITKLVNILIFHQILWHKMLHLRCCSIVWFNQHIMLQSSFSLPFFFPSFSHVFSQCACSFFTNFFKKKNYPNQISPTKVYRITWSLGMFWMGCTCVSTRGQW